MLFIGNVKLFEELVLVKVHLLTGWDDLTVGDHEPSTDDMKEQPDLDEPCRIHWEQLVELGSLCVELCEEELIHPEMQHVENAGEGVENRHTSREHKHTPKVSIVLGVNIMARNLISGVKKVYLVLKVLFGVHFVIIVIIWILLKSAAAASSIRAS